MGKREDGALRLPLAALYAVYFLAYFHRTVTGVLQDRLHELAGRSGWDPTLFASLASSAYFYAYAAAQLPSGVLADALGAGRYAALGSTLMALGSALSALEVPELFIAGRLLVGLGAASAWVCVQRLIGTRAARSRGGVLTGLGLAVGGLGGLAATLPARALADSAGLSGLLLLLAAAAPIPGAVALATVDDRGAGSGDLRRGLRMAVGQVKTVVGSAHFAALSTAALGTYAALLAYQSYWGQHLLTGCLGLEHGEAARLLLLTSVAFVLTVPAVGYVSDSVLRRRRPVLAVSCALHALLWAWSASLALGRGAELAPVYAVAVGAVGATHSVLAPLAREAYDPAFSGTSISLMNVVIFAGVALYQLTGYAVRDPVTAMALFASVAATAVPLSRWLRETLGPGKSEH